PRSSTSSCAVCTPQISQPNRRRCWSHRRTSERRDRQADERCGGDYPVTSQTKPTSPQQPLISSLHARDDAPIALLGGKGVNLTRLARAGFPVPDGFVVTTAAYGAFLASNAIVPENAPRADNDLEQLRARIAAARIPDDLSAQLLAA